MEDELTLWARFRVFVLLQEIAEALRQRACGREYSARVMLDAAQRLEMGR